MCSSNDRRVGYSQLNTSDVPAASSWQYVASTVPRLHKESVEKSIQARPLFTKYDHRVRGVHPPRPPCAPSRDRAARGGRDLAHARRRKPVHPARPALPLALPRRDPLLLHLHRPRSSSSPSPSPSPPAPVPFPSRPHADAPTRAPRQNPRFPYTPSVLKFLPSLPRATWRFQRHLARR